MKKGFNLQDKNDNVCENTVETPQCEPGVVLWDINNQRQWYMWVYIFMIKMIEHLERRNPTADSKI